MLARLDDANPRAALAFAEAQAEAARRNIAESEVRLADARLTLSRRMQLVKEKVVAQSEVDQAQADVDSIAARIAATREMVRVAERQVAMQQTDLDNTIIRAPFSGVAITKDAQPGEMVSPVSAGGGFTRTGICTIVDMKSLEIDVDVNESYINRVVSGQDVTAVLNAYPDWQIPARVITMVPTADRQKATVLVRIGFKQLDPRILPDMGVKVTFLAAAAKRPGQGRQRRRGRACDAARVQGGRSHRQRAGGRLRRAPGQQRRTARRQDGRRGRQPARGSRGPHGRRVRGGLPVAGSQGRSERRCEVASGLSAGRAGRAEGRRYAEEHGT